MPPEPIGDLVVKIWSQERQPLFFEGIFGDTLVDVKLIYIKMSNVRGDVSPSLHQEPRFNSFQSFSFPNLANHGRAGLLWVASMRRARLIRVFAFP